MLLKEAIQDFSDKIHITSIPDGRELMSRLVQEKQPQLILLDLNMPYKNGTECLKEIKSNPQWQHIPVVVLSTSRNTRDIEQCFNYGANLFFTKPCSFHSLKTLIHSILCINWTEFKTITSKHTFTQIATRGYIPAIEEIQ